ncbi:delta-aminolevulinic acid dehydratase, chloroplastic-like isoform X1 [Macadamia integrifolia]|uniref:delta-aminolevulinic acid dehydratase, chloroplastic-like isoform X1 n=2 Tax=Macadamia integrifolia TaxID=60698 RepID=UPI001C4EC958|nr:delta-aminolevulinic acid dehydratase, chloroplastic-like isoform X1 [Macadamia integrifolia]
MIFITFGCYNLILCSTGFFLACPSLHSCCDHLSSSKLGLCLERDTQTINIEAMAYAFSISTSNVGIIRPLDGRNHIGLRPSTNVKFVNARRTIKTQNRPLLVIRASEEWERSPEKLGLSDEECEATVVAGNVPEAPPIPPKAAAPSGTPVISPLLLSRRPRRNRKSPVLRSAFQETSISPANFVYPLFIHEGEEDNPIGAMPGCYRLGWRHGLIEEVYKARDVGINSVVLFPKVPEALKSPTGDEAYNDNGLVPRAIRLLKDKYPDIVIYTDVALDPYSSDGHDGIVREDGVIMNDETVHQLCKQAVSQARAGADVVSPSDMMDGRVGAIRAALDAEGFQNVSIMSYTAKYASSFYGPFREALDSNPRFGDKKTYQMNPANYREALVEACADNEEGADILLVKPGLPYLDIIRLLRDNSPLPIAAYQVSGEYSMIKAGAVLKMIDEEKVMMESLMCLRRAGADIILTYFALQAARCLCGERHRRA